MATVRFNTLTLLLVAILLAPIASLAETINVPDDYETIQAAIEAASNSDVVFVQPGIYNESIDFLGKSITVASRFIDTGEQEDIENTILDGEGIDARLVYFQNGEENSAILDGFTLRNAQGDQSGAIHIASSSPSLRNLLIHHNIAGQRGGGIHIREESQPIIQSVVLTDNESGDVGGGIACYTGSTVTLIDVDFVENRAENYGGGLYSSGCWLNLTNVNLMMNSSERNGGGAHFTGGSQVTGENITFISNSSRNGGGFTVFVEADVTFENVEVRANQAIEYGGGIQMAAEATMLISNFVMSENISTDVLGSGGGFSAVSDFEATLRNGQIDNNVAVYGSAINTERGELTLDHVLIHDNNEEVVTSVIHLDTQAILNFNNVTWVNNIEPIQCLSEININIENSILWEEQIFNIIREAGQIRISYTNVFEEYRSNLAEFVWGDGNLNVDPMFVDPDNADYNLDRFSPCINAGNPESEPDNDGSVTDLGYAAYIFNGVVYGVVTDLATGEPIQGVTISNLHNLSTVSDENGAYRFAPVGPAPFELHFSKQFFNPVNLEIDQIVEGEDLEVNLEMSYGVFSSNPDAIRRDVDPGSALDIDVTLENTGDGFLVFDIEKRLSGEFYMPLWENSLQVNMSEILDDSRLSGVALADDRLFITGYNNGELAIYVLNKDFELLETLPQPEPGESRYGMKDLCWDGELLWGVMNNIVLGFTTEMEVVFRFEAFANPSSYITVNPETNTLYTCGSTSDINEYTYGGQLVNTIDRQDLRIYGLGWFENDEDGMPLYISAKTEDYNQVYKMNPDDGELVEIEALRRSEGDGMGIFITDDFLPRNDVLLAIIINLSTKHWTIV